MPDPRDPSSTPASVTEIERRMRWPLLPVLVFIGLLVGLGVTAVLGTRAQRPVLVGLPEDADVRAAAELLRGRQWAGAEPLRFCPVPLCSMSDSITTGVAPLARAAALLARARARHPRDPRVVAAEAALDLARGDLVRAEQRYRAAVDLAGHYGEARLGLGVTLALAADRAGPAAARRARLEAIAQFAAARSEDPVYEQALFNRAMLLAKVGRMDEARRLARQYFARDSISAWARKLARAAEAER